MALQPLSLADLQISRSIADKEGRPSAELLRTINGNNRNTKQIVNALADQVADIQAALTAAGIALNAAQAGIRETARINSYMQPTSVLTATDDGTDVYISIANHVRVYPVQGSIDVPDVSISGGAITGLANSVTYYVYYDDTTLADETPTFALGSAEAAQPGAAPGRHFVGKITTPTDGGPPTTGTGASPPGGGGSATNPLP